ncbi:NAD(P)-dependent oxidoreductase [Paenibacillus sp. F411]|uniref:NAD-dependent epimerase/dehydratase n=1 Tax=Paenibacillus algicola TaxID=2565926 RepID=A0A4P8XLX4_9BACL|nr:MULTISPECIES: NAD(P)-dependent oxidoreductase [Paenibacillus]MBO2945909.1 NAD(P)-dependent oxidoreductase [Paenibacillus sp. F411]QCT01209.1 NAD-dependent epimerase/dehydratase [Paenibacillus algicola]
MRTVIIGAAGSIGKSILEEALRRGHQVTAVVRNPDKLEAYRDKIHVAEASTLDPDALTEAVRGAEAVISAYGPQFGQEEELLEAARNQLEACRRSGVSRLLVVGGAGSLVAENGEMLMNTAEFPAELRPVAQAHSDALEIYKASDLDWTYLSPAAMIEPGKRSGQFRIGMDHLVVDESGSSRISIEDYAVAMLDELEDPQFIRARFTVGY